MALCVDCFQEFLQPLFHELIEKNEAFWKRYGRHQRWDWDDQAGMIKQSRSRFPDSSLPALRIDVAVVGTTEGVSWQWSWANKNIDQRSNAGIDDVLKWRGKQLSPINIVIC
jgi:hypothetical protein